MSDYDYGLGRVPSPPDARDWRLEEFLPPAGQDFSVLDDALSKLNANRSVAQGTKDFGGVIVSFLKGNVPVPIPVPTGAVEWHDSNQLNQKKTGHCVGFGCAQWGNTDPVNDNFTDNDGHAIYYECKVLDGEPKAENGSYVRSGAKALQARGRLKAGYAFASELATIKQWVLQYGPVIVGTDWMNDMFKPDANGYVVPTGGLAGGHCYLIVGYDPAKDVFKFQNSWGSSWGLNGYFYMKASDWEKLFKNNGEAFTGVELAL